MTTRRDFLKTMTMASAGLALGTGDVLANPTSFAAQRKVTDKVKIAYIGIGNRGEQIINDFARTGMVEVIALCDVDMGGCPYAENNEQVSQGKTFPRLPPDVRQGGQ